MQFSEFVRALGLTPREIVADGRWHRCPTQEHPRKRNGAYMQPRHGRVGFAMDWSVHSEPLRWNAEEGPPEDPAELRRQLAESNREHAAMQAEAIEGARTFYAGCAALRGGHPYLRSHGLDMRGTRRLRVDEDGWLVVPASRAGQVVSVQRIAPDGVKRFWPGAPVSGSSFCIEGRRHAVSVLCEGVATGLAIYQSVPDALIVVGWNAGNLPKVGKLPAGLTVVAADNDHGTEERRGVNPGREAAARAAAELGCGVAWPEGVEGTDWADYRMEGLAKRQAEAGPYATDEQLQRAVNAELSMAIMRAATFRASDA